MIKEIPISYFDNAAMADMANRIFRTYRNVNPIHMIPMMADSGFILELVSDAWKPCPGIKPNHSKPSWRAVYYAFSKSEDGALHTIQDDAGCFFTYQEAYLAGLQEYCILLVNESLFAPYKEG